MERDKFENFLADYQEIKRQIRMEDPTLYERWKAGGFLVDNDIICMYPCLEGMLEDDLLTFEGENDNAEAFDAKAADEAYAAEEAAAKADAKADADRASSEFYAELLAEEASCKAYDAPTDNE
jgi:hypothetical protein